MDRVCAPAFECISEIELDERPELFASLAVAYNFDGIPRLGRHPSQHYRHVFRGEEFFAATIKKGAAKPALGNARLPCSEPITAKPSTGGVMLADMPGAAATLAVCGQALQMPNRDSRSLPVENLKH